MTLLLKNPHSVLAALEARPQDVLEIAIPPKSKTEPWERVEALGKKQGIRFTAQQAQDRKSKPGRSPLDESTRMGFASATIKERNPLALEELFEGAGSVSTHKEGVKNHGLWLALDSLQDTHNVGAIFRAAAFFGVRGILLTQDRSASLTGVVYDVASGGMESVPFAMPTNLQQAFDKAKEKGLWILGSSEHAHDDYTSVQLDRSWLLVLGNEEKGMRRLTEESCDVLCKIPSVGKVTSLNVSVAAGILISRFAGVS